MNDTVVKTKEYLALKKKAEILDKLVESMPQKIFSSDFGSIGQELVEVVIKNKELWS